MERVGSSAYDRPAIEPGRVLDLSGEGYDAQDINVSHQKCRANGLEPRWNQRWGSFDLGMQAFEKARLLDQEVQQTSYRVS